MKNTKRNLHEEGRALLAALIVEFKLSPGSASFSPMSGCIETQPRADLLINFGTTEGPWGFSVAIGADWNDQDCYSEESKLTLDTSFDEVKAWMISTYRTLLTKHAS